MGASRNPSCWTGCRPALASTGESGARALFVAIPARSPAGASVAHFSSLTELSSHDISALLVEEASWLPHSAPTSHAGLHAPGCLPPSIRARDILRVGKSVQVIEWMLLRASLHGHERSPKGCIFSTRLVLLYPIFPGEVFMSCPDLESKQSEMFAPKNQEWQQSSGWRTLCSTCATRRFVLSIDLIMSIYYSFVVGGHKHSKPLCVAPYTHARCLVCR